MITLTFGITGDHLKANPNGCDQSVGVTEFVLGHPSSTFAGTEWDSSLSI